VKGVYSRGGGSKFKGLCVYLGGVGVYLRMAGVYLRG